MLALTLVTVLLSAAWVSGAVADVTVNVNLGPPPPPVVMAAPPSIVVVPGVPLVQYAPSLHLDLFFHDRRWYYPHGGYWYVGPSYRGPWTPIAFAHLPPAIVAVPVKYYKVPPGHLKHHKPHDKDGPPGHAKGKNKH